MGKKKRPNQREPKAPVQEPGTGFGGLAAALVAGGLATSSPKPEPAAAPPKPAEKPAKTPKPRKQKAPKPAPIAPAANATGLLSGKAVVRQERKGRGGKTVTVIDGAAINKVDDLPALAKMLRKGLGAGARVEGKGIVVQGDQRTAASAWLAKQGASVVIGN